MFKTYSVSVKGYITTSLEHVGDQFQDEDGNVYKPWIIWERSNGKVEEDLSSEEADELDLCIEEYGDITIDVVDIDEDEDEV